MTSKGWFYGRTRWRCSNGVPPARRSPGQRGLHFMYKIVHNVGSRSRRLPFTPKESMSLLAATTPVEQLLAAAALHAAAPSGTVW